MLTELGWKQNDSISYERNGEVIVLTPQVIDVLDFVYKKGFAGGLDRMNYEEMTQEDV